MASTRRGIGEIFGSHLYSSQEGHDPLLRWQLYGSKKRAWRGDIIEQSPVLFNIADGLLRWLSSIPQQQPVLAHLKTSTYNISTILSVYRISHLYGKMLTVFTTRLRLRLLTAVVRGCHDNMNKSLTVPYKKKRETFYRLWVS